MREVGWEYGQAYDERNRLHDALVPFESLSPRDQRQVVQAVRALDIENALARAIRHDRGPDREFDAREMRPGLPIRTASSVSGSNGGRSEPRTGIVESWETDRDGWLTVIRVRWSDGSRSEHHPAERELARLT